MGDPLAGGNGTPPNSQMSSAAFVWQGGREEQRLWVISWEQWTDFVQKGDVVMLNCSEKEWRDGRKTYERGFPGDRPSRAFMYVKIRKSCEKRALG